MSNSMITSRLGLPATESLPGHVILLEDTDTGQSAAACSCGGFLEPIPNSPTAQLARFHGHLSDTLAEATRP